MVVVGVFALLRLRLGVRLKALLVLGMAMAMEKGAVVLILGGLWREVVEGPRLRFCRVGGWR